MAVGRQRKDLEFLARQQLGRAFGAELNHQIGIRAAIEASGDAEALRLYGRLEGTVSLKVSRRPGNSLEEQERVRPSAFATSATRNSCECRFYRPSQHEWRRPRTGVSLLRRAMPSGRNVG